MSLHEFGSSVDEVRQKLKEILPLVDAGHEAAEELHNRMQGDLSSIEEKYDSLAEAMNAVAEAGSEADDQISEWESMLSSSGEEWSNKLEDLSEKSVIIWSKIEEGQELVRSTFSDMNESISTAYEDASSGLTEMFSKAEELDSMVQSDQEETTSRFEEVKDALSELSSEFTSQQGNASEGLNALQMVVSEEWSNRLNEMMKGLLDSTAAEATSICESIATHAEGIHSFFSTFKSDSESLAQEYGNKASDIVSGLKDYAENHVVTTLTDGVEELVEKGITVFATGVGLSFVMAQTGVATSSALSPIIPEIVIAKKLTDVINSIF